MNKLAELIQKMSKEDLLLINRDLVSGNIDKAIQKKIAELNNENFSEKICPVCGGKISKDAYKLEFGKEYLRRRAYFDGADCLSYFVNNKLKNE